MFVRIWTSPCKEKNVHWKNGTQIFISRCGFTILLDVSMTKPIRRNTSVYRNTLLFVDRENLIRSNAGLQHRLSRQLSLWAPVDIALYVWQDQQQNTNT